MNEHINRLRKCRKRRDSIKTGGKSLIRDKSGGNLSPLLANIMLNELDKEMEKRGLNFVRYADDCAPRRRVQVA